jgi:hypothetical protein
MLSAEIALGDGIINRVDVSDLVTLSNITVSSDHPVTEGWSM